MCGGMRASGTEQTSEEPRGLFGGIGLMVALISVMPTSAAREAQSVTPAMAEAASRNRQADWR
jgi:hypothetical protein